MILPDTSVWIDYLRDVGTWQTEALDKLLGTERLLLGDLILTEVLQGYSREAEAERVGAELKLLVMIDIGGEEIAVRAARNYRMLRRKGITVRSTIDVLIATRCIADGLTLLHNDRDYRPFETELGLSVMRQQPH